MLTYLRYALATVCFTASVGCLALWWRSNYHSDTLRLRKWDIYLKAESTRGYVTVGGWPHYLNTPYDSYSTMPNFDPDFVFPVEHAVRQTGSRIGNFAVAARRDYWYSPHWYPALIFALAGVGTLRLGRRFTLRTALIATTAVAALLGIAVGL